VELAEGEQVLEQVEERPHQLGQAEVRAVTLLLTLAVPAPAVELAAAALAAEPVAAPEVAEVVVEAEAGEEEVVEDHLPPYLLHHSPLIPITNACYDELDFQRRLVGQQSRSPNALTV
jgi:hypothetical protein